MEKVFSSFHRFSPEAGGLRICLNVLLRIVEYKGGSIELNSKPGEEKNF